MHKNTTSSGKGTLQKIVRLNLLIHSIPRFVLVRNASTYFEKENVKRSNLQIRSYSCNEFARVNFSTKLMKYSLISARFSAASDTCRCKLI